MDPITISAAAGAVINLVDWKKVVKGLANDAISKSAKGLLEHLKPDDRERAAKRAVQLFVEEFLTELEDKTPLASAVPGYHDQLRRLIESAGPDITGWLQPETKEVDLGPVERMRCMSSPPDRRVQRAGPERAGRLGDGHARDLRRRAVFPHTAIAGSSELISSLRQIPGAPPSGEF